MRYQTMARRKLTGQVSECPACRLAFTSTHAFDKHRTGRIGSPERRCRSAVELRGLGWEPNKRYQWRKPRQDGGSMR